MSKSLSEKGMKLLNDELTTIPLCMIMRKDANSGDQDPFQKRMYMEKDATVRGTEKLKRVGDSENMTKSYRLHSFENNCVNEISQNMG